MSYKCIVGDSVTFKYNQLEGIGTVKFVGSLLPIKTGLWVGLERNEIDVNQPNPEGFNGKVADMKYFQCKKNKGIIVPYECVHIIPEPEPEPKPEPETTTQEIVEQKVEHSSDIDIDKTKKNKTKVKKQSQRIRQEPVDAKELAQKFKRSVKTKGDETMNKFKFIKRGNELKKKEIRASVSSRTAQLLQQQKLLSQTVSLQRKQFMMEQLKTKEDIKIKFSEQQLKAIDIMSNIFVMQTKQHLNVVVDDIQELQTRQQTFLGNISKSSIWFNKEERQKLNEMSATMNKIPQYRKKLALMKKKVHDIHNKVDKLKRDTNALKNKIGITEY